MSGKPGDPEELGSQPTMAADSQLSSHPSAAGKSIAPAPLIGGRYELLALAGSGAMGSVYRARDVELDEIVALKFLRSELGESAQMLERFRREVKLARRVTHPNVARVFDIGEHEKDRFLTMEFIDGETLSALLAREGALPVSRAAALARPICEGLAAAHAVGVVHRDLKPDNVMLARDGRLVITDFGIARSAFGGREGATIGGLVGTPAYMAPEQVECAPNIDQRADVYALGVMLFEMLTGALPFSGTSAITLAAARLTEPPPDPRSLRPTLVAAAAELVLRCMARRPDARFANASEVLEALQPLASAVETASTLARLAPSPRAGADTAAGEKTVAVLPFKNLGSADDAYIADGLTEDLVDTLSMAHGLRVRPRSAVQKLAQGDVDSTEVGRALEVQVIVEGSVRRRGDTLRVSARVLSVAEGFQLWARRFDRPAGDVLVISDEVAEAVSKALTVEPAGQHRAAPTDPVAIDLYLRARAELRAMSSDAMRRAVSLLEQAHERAPNDATILAALARAEVRLWFFDADTKPSDAIRRASELAERAVAVAPERGEALVALSQVRFAASQYVEAARLAARAVEHAPLLPEAHEVVGRFLVEANVLDRGIASLERSHQLDPLVETPIFELSRAYALQGDFARAKRFLEQFPPVRGAISRAALFARFALWSGAPEDWLPMLPPLQTDDPLSPVNMAIAALDVISTKQLSPEFRTRLRELGSWEKRPARFRCLLNQVGAEFEGYAGNVEGSLDFLEAAVAADLVDLAWLELCPVLAALRDTPRYAAARAIVRERAAAILTALGA